MQTIFPGKRKVGRPSKYEKAVMEGKENPEQYITEYMKYTHGLGYEKPGCCAFCGTRLTSLSTLAIGFKKACRRCYDISPLGRAERRQKREQEKQIKEGQYGFTDAED